MCCLKNEQEVYEEKLSRLPNIGATVKTEDGEGIVEDVQVLKELVTVKIQKEDDTIKKVFPLAEIELIKNVRRKDYNRHRGEDEVSEKELKALEEGFKRTDDI